MDNQCRCYHSTGVNVTSTFDILECNQSKNITYIFASNIWLMQSTYSQYKDALQLASFKQFLLINFVFSAIPCS